MGAGIEIYFAGKRRLAVTLIAGRVENREGEASGRPQNQVKREKGVRRSVRPSPKSGEERKRGTAECAAVPEIK